MKFRVGDTVRIKQSDYVWGRMYVGKIGIIIDNGVAYDWHVWCDNIAGEPITAWLEKDLEPVRKIGEQLEFDW